MGIQDENLFASMRMVLPEHRMAMGKMKRERSERTRPLLSEDAWEEMQFVLGEAIVNQLAVEITLFGKYRNEVVTGVPEMRGQMLQIVINDEDRCVIKSNDIISVVPHHSA